MFIVDKPIAFELGDYKSYKNGRGFIVDNPLDFMPGEKINNPNDLYTFIDNVFNGVDKYQEERKNLKNKMHKYVDGNSSERVLDYFELIN